MVINLKSNIKKISIIIIILILFACHKNTPATASYYLLFTDDVATFGNQTALVSFDQEGELLETVELNGALYYNLLQTENGFTIDNGLQEISISSNKHNKSKHSELRGYFEQGHYVTYEETLIKFYNYGIEEKLNKYFTKIEKQGQLLTIEGLLLSFQQDGHLVYMIFQEYPEIDSPYYFVTLDLQSFSFKKGNQLPFSPNNEYYFFDNQSQDTYLLGLETNPETSSQTLIKISVTNPQNVHYFSLEDDFYQLYNNQSFFNYRNKSYIFDKFTNQLYQINLDEENSRATFKKENLQLGGNEENFIVQQIKDDKLYLLKLTYPYQINEITLSEMKLTKQVNLEYIPQMNNLATYSFYVNSK